MKYYDLKQGLIWFLLFSQPVREKKEKICSLKFKFQENIQKESYSVPKISELSEISEFKQQHAKRLIDSFKDVTGNDLIELDKNMHLGQQLFEAPFVVVSHNGGDDPVLNYGNSTALNLWEMSWDDFTQTPSRKTAEPEFRNDRAAMLQQAKDKGYFNNYTGIRISSSGKRFLIEKAIIWTVPSVEGSDDPRLQKAGQAATFSDWKYL